MSPASQQRNTAPTITISREVRWFRHGAVPSDVVEWFTASGTRGDREQRLDVYDTAAARNGIGLKQRDAESCDRKRMLASEADVSLAPGLQGCVEDWVKTSTPLEAIDGPHDMHDLPVEKDIITRAYTLETPGGSTAVCEAALAAIRVGNHDAWTLCFEAFGSSPWVEDAFQHGIERLLEDTPLPDGLAFVGNESCGYPAWLASLGAPESAATV